jgi:hypothetical protein
MYISIELGSVGFESFGEVLLPREGRAFSHDHVGHLSICALSFSLLVNVLLCSSSVSIKVQYSRAILWWKKW